MALDEPEPQPVRIPVGDLSADALRNVVEEFVTRDGTDLTEASTKIEQVLAQLRGGSCELWFDATTRTCNVVARGR